MIIQTINSIEVSSLCDRSCKYCPAREQGKHREVGLMSTEIFEKALEWVLHFSRKGTQRELNLFGVGEPTLNPNLPAMIEKARRVLPMRCPVHINTNGQWIDTHTTAITDKEIDYARSLKLAGISHIDITGHDAFKTAKMIRIFQALKIQGQLSFDYITNPNNWAGQVDWFHPMYDAGPCPWVGQGQVMVMNTGDITRCCIDAFGKGIFAHVNDDISEAEVTTFELCDTCHHKVGQQRRIITA
jgi:MoaA/NifB/PqqE/SkfB family radical SAM enzyme